MWQKLVFILVFLAVFVVAGTQFYDMPSVPILRDSTEPEEQVGEESDISEDTGLVEAFLRADGTADLKKSLSRWKAVERRIAKSSASDVPRFIALDKVQRIIIDRYMARYQVDSDDALLKDALDYVNGYENQSTRLWSMLHILDTIARYGGEAISDESYYLVQDILDAVQFESVSLPSEERKRLLYTLATILAQKDNTVTFRTPELRVIHQLIIALQNPEHRIRILQLYGALSARAGSGIYPEAFVNFYRQFSRGRYPKAQKLITLHRQALRKDQFNLSLYTLLAIDEEKQRNRQLRDYFKMLMNEGLASRARRVADNTDNPAAGVYMWSTLERYYMEYGYVRKAQQAHERAAYHAARITKPSSAAKARKTIDKRRQEGMERLNRHVGADVKKLAALKQEIDEKLGTGSIRELAQKIRAIEATSLRVEAFRYLAEQQALQQDRYRILENATQEHSGMQVYTFEGAAPGDMLSAEEVQQQEDEVLERFGSHHRNVATHEAIPSDIGSALSHSALPEKATMTGQQLRSMIPLPTRARVTLSHYENSIFNSTFRHTHGNSGFVLRQDRSAPLIIIIERGIIDISGVYDELKAQNRTTCMSKFDGGYTLHCPLVVGNEATFIATGDDVSEVRLSSKSGAYIVNANRFFMSDIVLTSWDDQKQAPQLTDFNQKDYFRPFFTSWNRSYSYIGNSELIALGYDHGKSYGISFSSGPNIWYNLGDIQEDQRPQGMIINNSFNNIFFGFYAYEATDTLLIGNEYIDNIVYGIDPHDRSEYLVIAYNTAYGTHKKHGIIISREVNKSIIMGNVSFDNKGTGIMLDRESIKNLIYANTVFDNADGISVYESNCNIAAANLAFDNKGAGLRVRNSYDIGLYHNHVRENDQGISAYSLILRGNPHHSHRDFVMDPYNTVTAFSAVGNILEENGTGVYVENIDAMFLKANQFVNQAPSLFRGDWFAERAQDFFRLDREENGAVVSRVCPSVDEPVKIHHCMFRDDRTLRGDGQDGLMQRLEQPVCEQAGQAEGGAS